MDHQRNVYLRTMLHDLKQTAMIVHADPRHVRIGAPRIDDHEYLEGCNALFSQIGNFVIDGRRRIGRESTLIQGDASDATDMIAADGPDPEEKAIARGQVRLLEQALSQLPEKSRIALEMHRFGGCKYAEIARRLDVSVGTAHALVAGAIEHCKQVLAKGG